MKQLYKILIWVVGVLIAGVLTIVIGVSWTADSDRQILKEEVTSNKENIKENKESVEYLQKTMNVTNNTVTEIQIEQKHKASKEDVRTIVKDELKDFEESMKRYFEGKRIVDNERANFEDILGADKAICPEIDFNNNLENANFNNKY